MADNAKINWAERKIGALWKSRSGKGYNGSIEIGGKKISVVVFENTYWEEGTKDPFLKIYKGDELPAGGRPAPAQAASSARPAQRTQQSTPRTPQRQQAQSAVEVESEDIL